MNVLRSHFSTPVQAFPSSHFVSELQGHALESMMQPPAVSLQESEVHATPSSHFTADPPHFPFVQASADVQTRPSSQVVPSGRLGVEHAPFAGLHVPGP